MYFFRYAIETALDMRDWNLALRYANAFQQRMQKEPTPWSDFHIQQGRVLAGLGRGDTNKQLPQKLDCLRALAIQVGIAAKVQEFNAEGIHGRS